MVCHQLNALKIRQPFRQFRDSLKRIFTFIAFRDNWAPQLNPRSGLNQFTETRQTSFVGKACGCSVFLFVGVFDVIQKQVYIRLYTFKSQVVTESAGLDSTINTCFLGLLEKVLRKFDLQCRLSTGDSQTTARTVESPERTFMAFTYTTHHPSIIFQSGIMSLPFTSWQCGLSYETCQLFYPYCWAARQR